MKSRSGIQVMAGLIGMIRPLLSKMCLAVLMGCVGNLMATFITVLGAYGLTTWTDRRIKAFGDIYTPCGIFGTARYPAVCGAGKQPLHCI